jgi:hypothetical protein
MLGHQADAPGIFPFCSFALVSSATFEGFVVQLSGRQSEHEGNYEVTKRRNGEVSVPTEPYESAYRAMVKSLRASLADETDCLYCIHTPVGTINVIAWNYVIPGMVAITGKDEDGEYRFVVFSEEQVRYFPLEIKRKKLEALKKRIEPKQHEPKVIPGFKVSFKGSAEDKA